jgi:hypothetical protein
MKLNPFRREPNTPNNDALLKAITAVAAQGTPESQRVMYMAILNSTLLMAEDPKYSPRPIMFVTPQSEVVLPVFTDTERLRKICPDALKVAALPAREICRLAISNKIFIVNINPQQGPGCDLLQHELEALAQGRIPDVSSQPPNPLGEPTLVPFGSPKLPSQELIDQMMDKAQTILSRESVVDEAYIILVGDEEGSHLAIGLRFGQKANTDLKSSISQRLIPALEAVVKRPMEILWLTDEDLKQIQSVQQPFYKRK